MQRNDRVFRFSNHNIRRRKNEEEEEKEREGAWQKEKWAHTK